MPATHTVLVVDDEADVVRSVQDLLRLEYRVLGETRASEACKLLEREEVHIIMTDQRMPEMSGVDFLRHCRNEYPDAIRLLFTGYADIRAVIEAINQGNVYRYITKPWDPDELLTIIRDAAEKYDLIVARKRLLAELQQTNQELASANAKLQQLSDLKSGFIRVASHELRTPLTILLGMTSLVHRVPNLPDPAPEYVSRIERAGLRLQYLVDQIITMLLAERFDRPLSRQMTNLSALLEAAADDVRPFVELRHQTLALDVTSDLGEVALDAGKIRDSVNHLLLNAIKFTPDGGRIALGASRDDGQLAIQVSDNGVGIDPQCLPRLFEPFFTGFDVAHHSSGQYEFARKGLGLGLSVVKAFVELHGGSITAASQPGKGTTITLRLPVLEQSPGA
jgi:signal transduction histidine kinase